MPLEPIPFMALPADAQGRLDREIEPGERLLWAGVGARGGPVEPTGYIVALVLAGVAWAVGLAVIARASRAVDTAAAGNPVADAGLVIVGILALIVAFAITMGLIGMAAAAFIGRLRRRPWPVYAITDRRVIMSDLARSGGGIEVGSLRRGEVDHVRRIERDDGRWDIQYNTTLHNYYGVTSFAGVRPDPQVERLAREVLLAAGLPDDGPPPGEA